MPIKLNEPQLSCPHCQGKGAFTRKLHLVIHGAVQPYLTQVFLHCRCVSPELEEAHAKLDKDNVLREWPWPELEGKAIPRAKDGPEPLSVGCPFPVMIS